MGSERIEMRGIQSSRMPFVSSPSFPRNDGIEEALELLDANDWTNMEIFLHPWGEQRVTIVHLAAYRGNIEMLKRAAALGADLYATDKLGRSALYYAAEQGHIDVIEWLIHPSAAHEGPSKTKSTEHQPSPTPYKRSNKNEEDDDSDNDYQYVSTSYQNENEESPTDQKILHGLNIEPLNVLPCKQIPGNFNTKDKDGRTPLHAAVYGGHLNCVRILINQGFCLANATNTGVTVMEAIFQQLPNPMAFLTEILDDQVTMNDENSSNEVILDFQILTGPPSSQIPMAKSDTISDLQVIVALINAVPNMEQMTILQHPLLAVFLHEKYWPVILLNLFLILCDVYCVIFLYRWYVTCVTSTVKECNFLAGGIIMGIILLVTSAIGVFNLVSYWVKIFGSKLYFRNTSILLRYAGLILLPCIVGYFISYVANTIECKTYPCVYSPATPFAVATTILLFVAHTMLVLGRFPILGEYMFMFIAVLSSVGKVLAIFACLIIGFALSFSVLFSNIDQFSTSWKALVKTIVMMTGEFDYGDLFPKTDENNSMANNPTSTANNDTSLPVITAIIFLIFLIATSIVLMNLVVGLAVNNVQQLLKEGCSRRLLIQAETTFHWIELHHSICRLLRIFGRQSKKSTTSKLHLDMNSRSCIPWRGIPADLKKNLCELALKNSNRKKRSQTNLPRHNTQDSLAAIETLLAAMQVSHAAMQSSLQRMAAEQRLQYRQMEELRQDCKTKRQRRSL